MKPRLAAAVIVAALASCAAVIVLTASEGEPKPFRIGVAVDCVGINRALYGAELGAAELPLVERGADLVSDSSITGVAPVEVGGRRVELVAGCTESWEFNGLIEEVRRLVEREGAEAILAAGSGADQVVLADVARRYPSVPMLAVGHGPREVTLDHPPANLYRFSGDWSQGAAGLGAYAYRRLGWRRAAVALFNWDSGWGARDGFVAEFCALGGRVGPQLEFEGFSPSGTAEAKAVPRDVDGVAVFAPAITGPTGFLKRLAGRYRDPARHLLLGPMTVDEPVLLNGLRGRLSGVGATSFNDPARLRTYLRRFSRAFPGIPRELAAGELVTGYRDAMAALLAGLETAADKGVALPSALAQSRVDLLGGPVHLDRNRQAVISTWQVSIDPDDRPLPGLALERTRRNVDQSLGGLLGPASSPGEGEAPCPATGRT